jgi:hypothetical protein
MSVDGRGRGQSWIDGRGNGLRRTHCAFPGCGAVPWTAIGFSGFQTLGGDLRLDARTQLLRVAHAARP